MNRFLSAVCLCLFLLVSGLFVFLPKSEAQTDILPALLRLPAPPPPNPLVENGKKNRSRKFYSKSNPPGDDAPIEDLLDYWKFQSESYRLLGYNPVLKGKSLERILGEIANDPELLTDYLKVFPDSTDVADFVKQIYDRNSSDKDFGGGAVKNWLLNNNKYYSDDLAKEARKTGESGEYVSNQEPFLALARVDWEKARPLVDRLYFDSSQPVSQVLARWAYYRHALDTGSMSDTDRYRDELKAIVEDRNATAGMRDLAFDALVREKEWDGLFDWYLTLLEDETLAELKVNGSIYTGLTTLIYYNPPEKYAEKMIKLLKSDNKTVRTAVVRNLARILAEDTDPEVVRALLPWLEDPDWAKEVRGERRTLINALQNIMLPESVPGLITVLNEKVEQETVIFNSNSAVNRPVSNTAANTAVIAEYYPYRREAIEALATQKDTRAAPALRKLLAQATEYELTLLVSALLASNGFSVPEQIEALETVAKDASKENFYPANAPMANLSPSQRILMERMIMEQMRGSNSGNYPMIRVSDPSDIKSVLGNAVAENTEPRAELVTAVIERIGVLSGKDPELAAALRRIVKTWNGAAINSLLLRDLKTGKAELDSIVKLLSERKNIREKQPNEIYDARSGENRIAFGITACLLDNNGEYEAILDNENAEIKAAMLGCARMIRAQLPIQKVAKNLKDANKVLALAAELYLESEDSPEARGIVLSLHPDEAKILGAWTYFAANDSPFIITAHLTDLFLSVNGNQFFQDDFSESVVIEKKLQKEVKENEQLLGVYAYDQNFIRIYKDKAVFSWQENNARYRERDLTKEEFDDIKDYISENKFYEFPPFLYACEDECEEKELVMLGRQGGRRVFVKAERMPPLFAGLDIRFEKLREEPAKLRYELEKDIAGLEILFTDDILQAQTVWKTGDDFRVLIDDTARREKTEKELELADEADEENEALTYPQREERSVKRSQQRQFEHLSWFKFDKGRLPNLADQPLNSSYIPARDNFAVRATNQQWKTKTANIEIRIDTEGLYKISGGAFTKIRDGYYIRALLTANGRWAIVTKYSDEEDGPVLTRIDLQTNKEFPIKVVNTPALQPIAVIPSTNKVLLFAGEYYEYRSENGKYILLDAETGIAREVKGEIRPLKQQTFRPLQPTGAADEFWAALPDSDKNETQIGAFNAKDLSFKPLLKIPNIQFDSMDMWIDGGRVYFVFEGHLLSIPLPKAV